MPAVRIEHYLVLSDDIDKTRDFYCNALGMTQGFRPQLAFAGYWLYAEGTPSSCIHIGEWASYTAWTRQRGLSISDKSSRTGPVDHIAFNATDFEAMRQRLESLDIELRQNSLPEIGLRQLFLHDPNGVPIELNFRS